MAPPTMIPMPIFTEKRAYPATVRTVSSPRLPLIMTAKRLSPKIAVIFFLALPTGNHVDILESGCYTDKEKNKKEPRLCTEPAIKCQTEPNPDRNRQSHRDTHARDNRQALQQLPLLIIHEQTSACRSAVPKNLSLITYNRRWCQFRIIHAVAGKPETLRRSAVFC